MLRFERRAIATVADYRRRRSYRPLIPLSVYDSSSSSSSVGVQQATCLGDANWFPTYSNTPTVLCGLTVSCDVPACELSVMFPQIQTHAMPHACGAKFPSVPLDSSTFRATVEEAGISFNRVHRLPPAALLCPTRRRRPKRH